MKTHYRNFYKIDRKEFYSVMDAIAKRRIKYELLKFGNRFGITQKFILYINHKRIYGLYIHNSIIKIEGRENMITNSEYFINPDVYNLLIEKETSNNG